MTAPATPDFTLTVDPSELTLPRGSAVAVRVTAGIAERFFNDPIDLSINGLPAGVNAGFDGTPILPFGGSNLWLFIDSSIAPGTYPVMVTGTSGSRRGCDRRADAPAHQPAAHLRRSHRRAW